MLCTIYKSTKKDGAYLYVEKRDDFSRVPDALMSMFGRPILSMVMNLEGKKLVRVDIDKVKSALENEGFFLQLPPPPVNLLEEHKARRALQK